MATENSPLVAGAASKDSLGPGIKGVILRMLGPGQEVLAKLGLTGIGFAAALFICILFSGDLRKLVLATFVLNGLVAASFGFRMTVWRIASTNEEGLTETDGFKRWNRSQINNSEWNPMIMLLKFVIVYLSGEELGFVGAFSAVWTDVGTLLYFLGVLVFYDELGNDRNSMFGIKLPPFRFAGVLTRYCGLYLMLLVIWAKI